MKKYKIYILFLSGFLPIGISATGLIDSTQEHTVLLKRQYQASKIHTPPKIDGKLDDVAWIDIPVASDFTALEPVPFKPMSIPSDVKLAFDDQAVYVSARLKDDPNKIRRDLSQRDQTNGNTDWFSVNFDCFNDDQPNRRRDHRYRKLYPEFSQYLDQPADQQSNPQSDLFFRLQQTQEL